MASKGINKPQQLKKQKISFLIHTQYYPPEIGAPQNRLSGLADSLLHNGFQVSVLTAMPNYPTGKIHRGYHKLFCKEEQSGVKIFRSFIIPSKTTAFLPRIINYFSFVLSSLIMGVFISKYTYLLTESPPLFLGISGLILSRLKKSKWILNISDLWPSSAVELEIIKEGGFLHKLSTWLEKFLYQKAWLVTGQSRTILQVISNQYSNISTYLLSNGIKPETNSNELIQKEKQKTTIIYAGLHGLAQGLEQIIEAAKDFQDNELIEIKFYGDGPQKENLIRLVKDYNLKNVFFFDPLPVNEIPQILATSDILIVPLRTHLTGAVPSKLYEAMAAAKPIILVARGEAAEIVELHDCGIVVPPGNIELFTKSIRKLCDDPKLRDRLGSNGRKAVIENFDRGKIFQKFADYLIAHSPIDNVEK